LHELHDEVIIRAIRVLWVQKGPHPMQEVVVSAVRNAVRAATNTFAASSMMFNFFMLLLF